MTEEVFCREVAKVALLDFKNSFRIPGWYLINKSMASEEGRKFLKEREKLIDSIRGRTKKK